jgi:hypothetical protein
MALVHYPVVNRHHEVIAAAITNLDLHDLARLARTYDLPGCFVITPLQDQQRLAKQLLSHWCEGIGRELHPHRRQALERLRIVDDIEAARATIAAETGMTLVVWATSANPAGATLSHREARRALRDPRTRQTAVHLVLLGTAWGLTPGVLATCDAVLDPIHGGSEYNHLSVRCAAAILVDRLCGWDREQ